MSSVCRGNSGVDWLCDIPSDWHSTPTHAVTLATDTYDPGKEPENEFSYINVSSICNEVHEITEYEILAGYEAPTRARNVVSVADTIFATVRPYLRNIAQIPMGLHASICSTGYCVLRAERTKVNPRYLFFSCVSAGFVASVVAHQQGANYPAVSDRVVRRQVIPLPPLPEQRAIAAYLDRETAKIDALIVKTEQLNALLREKRVALISQAVTKGLDPAAPLKDSGVEWLGEIPAHWDVKRLKHVTTYTGSGKTPKGGAEVYKSSGILFLRSQNVHFEGLRLSDVAFISHEIDSEMRSSRVKANDVLLNITGASLGRCSVVPYDFPAANVNQHVCIVRPYRQCVDSELLNYSMASDVVQSQIFSTENGSSREGITFQQIRDFWIALPSDLAEQRAIADHLDRETAKIDALIAKNDKLIALLREKRTALISATVTGKIDLRNEA